MLNLWIFFSKIFLYHSKNFWRLFQQGWDTFFIHFRFISWKLEVLNRYKFLIQRITWYFPTWLLSNVRVTINSVRTNFSQSDGLGSSFRITGRSSELNLFLEMYFLFTKQFTHKIFTLVWVFELKFEAYVFV